MSYPIEAVEGIGPAYAKKLAAAGCKTTKQLLDSCCTRKGRKDMAAKTGLSEKRILEWANLADLMRINGIGPQYSELLEAAGVDTVKELRNRNADNLVQKMKEVNAVKKLTRRVPPAGLVSKWIDAAKSLDPVMSY
ncbi:MAG: DUF4332 domain-containing protein [Acidobacteria bacterium]|nr:MAG: DUF4332 domain-containing protein [Acidobacteriota bacterium]